jgi:hypothetical protein
LTQFEVDRTEGVDRTELGLKGLGDVTQRDVDRMRVAH